MFDSASISAAIGSAKVILDLAKNANDAQLAMRIGGEVANLQGKLIDVQQQTLAIQNENQALREEIIKLKGQLADTVEADPCPKCRRKGWHVESSSPDHDLGFAGMVNRVYRCSFCQFTESKLTR